MRGCVYTGQHYDQCLRDRVFGGKAECDGCLRVPAAHGVMVCQDDWNRYLGVLQVAPDLVTFLRTVIDPTKAVRYGERVSTSKPDAPAPMDVSAVDAVNEIVNTIIGQAEWHGDERTYGRWSVGVPAGATGVEVHDQVGPACAYLTDHAAEVLNSASAGDTVRVLLDDGVWTVERALARWPHAAWAVDPYQVSMPCLSCERRTVLAYPASIPGFPTNYRCLACGWAPSDADHSTVAAYLEGEPA
ncbi:hypothetical protein D9V30_10325 [Mycetocola reblochoni]|uniref:Phage protein n=2 Tax=Mycetocola reblochoni TaxID=331618 RepID=A0A1R4JPP5_9MICO|nr:hypothetical protein D9V30_10325 [Mycetocola reblochoni]SJN33976.1 Phage protein [Mycetocola reblochoni REB411]